MTSHNLIPSLRGLPEPPADPADEMKIFPPQPSETSGGYNGF